MSMPNSTNSSQPFGELIAELKNLCTTQLRDRLSEALDKAETQLFDLADEAAYSHEKDVYYMLHRKLKEYNTELTVDFTSNILSLLRPYTETQAEEAEQKKKEPDDDLSLVEQDDMEDIVLVKNLSAETTARFREKITNLEIRLDHLALKTPKIFAKNALSPAKICQAYDDILIEKFDVAERKVMFKLFKDNVAQKLDSFYDELNKKLIQAGVLPQIKMHGGRGPARPAVKPQPAPVEMPPEQPYADDGMEYGGYFGDSGDYGFGGGYGAAPGMAGAMPGGAPGGMPGGMPGGAPAGMPGGMPGGAPAGMPGGMPGGAPAGMPGGMPGGAPGPMPAGAPGGMPGAAPGGAPGGLPGNTQGGGPAGAVPGGMQGGTQPGTPGGAAVGPAQGGVSLGNYPAGQTATPGNNYGNVQPGSGSAQSQGQPGQTGGGYTGTLPPPNAQGVYQHYTAGLPASQVSSTLGHFFGAPLAPAGAESAHSGQAVEAYPASTAQYFGHDEIISALSSIQAHPQFAESEELRFDSEAVKQAVLGAIARTSGGLVTKRINQIAEKTIDFIELIFDAIIEDENISDTIKALLLRLQIPVIKASMLDQEFFIYDDHPARILLDRITEVGMGVTDHKDEVYQRLDKIVGQLIGEYQLDTETFQNALDKVNEFVKEREDAARAREEEAQRQTLREHARNAVLKSLRNITAGRQIPEAIHTLVLKRWPTIMFNHYIDHGKENDGWVAIVELLRDIMVSVQPFQCAEDFAYLRTERDNLIKRVMQQLSRTYKSKKDIQSVIEGLITTYDEMIEDANYLAEEIETAERVVAEKPREKEPIKPEPPHVPETKLPSNVMPGMWFQITIDEGRTTRRCKLSVIIVEDEKLIFVTHDGEVIAEKSFKEFTEELAKGTAQVIMGHSVFDYALNSVITKLEPTLH